VSKKAKNGFIFQIIKENACLEYDTWLYDLLSDKRDKKDKKETKTAFLSFKKEIKRKKCLLVSEQAKKSFLKFYI